MKGPPLVIFPDITTFIIKEIEQGYVDNPSDPGGETKYGISKRSYPEVDIKNLTMSEALDIYKKDYWVKSKADLVPPNIGLIHMDAAIHHGPSRAIRMLQEAAGVTIDGVIGSKTAFAIYNRDPGDLLLKYLTVRTIFLTKNKNFQVFGKGWIKRMMLIALNS